MKHIAKVLSKNPPTRGKPQRRKQGKGGLADRVVRIGVLEQYALAGGFKLPPEKKSKKTKTNPQGAGRPTVVTQEVIGKLEMAFVYDATVEEACLEAGINADTYYSFVKKYPAFTERVAELRRAPMMMVRRTILRDAQTNPDMAMKYAERKNKVEFSTRSEVAHTGEVVNRHMVDPEQAALIKNAMGNFAKKIQKMAEAQTRGGSSDI